MVNVKIYINVAFCLILLCSPASAARRADMVVNSSAFIVASAFAVWAAFGNDHRASAYAMERLPVYGSPERAQRTSDILQYVSVGLALFIYAVKNIPQPDAVFDYSLRPQNIIHTELYTSSLAMILSGVLTNSGTEMLKEYTLRLRPNEQNNLSFPSGHATAAAWANHASALMIRDSRLKPQYTLPLYCALATMTLSTAWGRVEAGKHYPSDVLAGIFLGVALTDISFATFQSNENNQAHFAVQQFDINFTNTRGITNTALQATIDF